MGRGLAAILAVAQGGDDTEELRQLPVELIVPNAHQPRRHFDREALSALADSLRERGVIQPVLVRPRPGGTYELIAGERRWRAAKLARIERIPAVVRARDDAAALELALIENMVREDLRPLEAARACAALVEELGLKHEEVGRRVGRSRVSVSNLIRLLDLPDEAQDLLEDGSLTEGHGRALLLAEDHAARKRLARAAAQGGWSVRTLEQRARECNAPATEPRSKPAVVLHPDQEAGAREVADALRAALGVEVHTRSRGTGLRVELEFASLDEALALARRLRPPLAA
jgi:ParB family chromosome partitioning protein